MPMAVSSTILKYRKLKVAHSEEQENTPNVSGSSYLSLLLEAWKPISVGHKRRWWDCIALPFDVESSDEVAFRVQIREMAFTSLQLLKAAIFDEECKPLFSLDIYGHIIGMFELNNLDLVVASPVEDYFLYNDDLPYPEKKEAEEITRPFLDALGGDYSVCCQGTAFYPLQSCVNHSCGPNAKAFKREEDRDGQATIIALKPISEGEEVPKMLRGRAITNEAALNTIDVEEVMRFVKGMIDELNLVGPFIILMFNYATFVKFKIDSVIWEHIILYGKILTLTFTLILTLTLEEESLIAN